MLYASLAFVAAAALVPTAPVYTVQTSRRAVSPVAIAMTPEERKVLAASRKVTTIAQRFGAVQGQAAQKWVEKAVTNGETSSEVLMEMQLALFDECSVDDESGRCKALSEAIVRCVVDALRACLCSLRTQSALLTPLDTLRPCLSTHRRTR